MMTINNMIYYYQDSITYIIINITILLIYIML